MRFILLILAAFLGSLFASPEAGAIGWKTAPNEIFSGTLEDAGQNGPAAREQCRINGWLKYDTAAECTVAARGVSAPYEPVLQSTAYAIALYETLGRDDDGKINAYSVYHESGSGGSWDTHGESRGYSYDPDNRRLTTETFQPSPESPVPMETLKYTFDADDLGVRVKAENETASNVFWEADPANNGLDAFKRLKTEDRESEFYSFLAKGSSVGPGKFSLWLGDGVSPSAWSFVDTVYPDPDYGSGQWEVPLALPDGQYTLKAEAEHVHPDSTFTSENDSTFTVDAGGEHRTVSNIYDQSGKLTSRSWAGGHVTQTFTWDATGRLVQVVQEDTRATPLLPDYTWTAVYDGAGRRIQTGYVPNNAPLAGAEAARTIRSWFDPSVEFLEIAVETQGKRWWKFHGPDLDADYGSFQGIGGLEAVVDEETETVYPIIDDAFGHVVGYIDLGTLTDPEDDEIVWTEVQMSGYGPLPGNKMKPLEESGDLLKSLAWQTRRIDPTGYFWMGARYYDPASGSFLSTDPLGHAESMDLYSYANGDPINFFDPTGRRGDGVTETSTNYSFNPDGSIGYSSTAGMPSQMPSAEYGDPHFEAWEANAFRERGIVPMEGEPANSALIAGSMALGGGAWAGLSHSTKMLLGMGYGGGEFIATGDPLSVVGMGPLDDAFDAARAARTTPSFFEGASYTPKVLKQMQGKAGEFHSFPESVTAFESAGLVRSLIGGDKAVRQVLDIPGSYGSGGNGVFRFIKNADGTINERRFVPNSP